MDKDDQKRIVESPQAGSAGLSGEILSVELGEDEEVVWQWTHQPDGSSFVTGYEIIQKKKRSNE